MILLSRAYMGYAAGTIVQLTTAAEAAAIAQGIATTSAGPVTPGAVTTTMNEGRVGISAGTASVVVTNPNVTTESKINAYLSNSGADATALYVTRVVPANGSFTIYVNANATAAIAIDWWLAQTGGDLPQNV